MQYPSLPPMKSLLAFEAAVKRGNLTLAAADLYVTPAAVSQQVRRLEQHIGFELFLRSKSGVELTLLGSQFNEYVITALATLRNAQQINQPADNKNQIIITALPSFASKWLMPKVLTWMDRNPNIQITVQAQDESEHFNQSSAHMCISFGIDSKTLDNSIELFTDHVSLVLSPQLLEGLTDPSNNNEIAELPMIDVDWGHAGAFLPSWGEWLAAAGLSPSVVTNGPKFNLSSMAIDAAVSGKGVLLGQRSLIQAELDAGNLIAPFETKLPLKKSYYLVYPQHTLKHQNAMAFIDWLVVQE
ncbi:MAG TPA: LysR family transcriptional regulator [Oceanospirillaceae bacterium]|nr:LysR family transcriptional regulator [Oceanospirillaceae bacterium]